MGDIPCKELKEVMVESNRDAKLRSHGWIIPEHVLLAIVRGADPTLRLALGEPDADLRELIAVLDAHLKTLPLKPIDGAKLPQTREVKKVFETAVEETTLRKKGI